jgi:hypothetical protein
VAACSWLNRVSASRPRLTWSEAGVGVRAFIEPVAVGDTLINMPLFLQPGRYVEAPLEETYRIAFDSVPRRWRAILEPT